MYCVVRLLPHSLHQPEQEWATTEHSSFQSSWMKVITEIHQPICTHWIHPSLSVSKAAKVNKWTVIPEKATKQFSIPMAHSHVSKHHPSRPNFRSISNIISSKPVTVGYRNQSKWAIAQSWSSWNQWYSWVEKPHWWWWKWQSLDGRHHRHVPKQPCCKLRKQGNEIGLEHGIRDGIIDISSCVIWYWKLHGNNFHAGIQSSKTPNR